MNTVLLILVALTFILTVIGEIREHRRSVKAKEKDDEAILLYAEYVIKQVKNNKKPLPYSKFDINSLKK